MALTRRQSSLYDPNLKHNKCRHGDALYNAPSAPFQRRACCKRYIFRHGAIFLDKDKYQIPRKSDFICLTILLDDLKSYRAALDRPE